MEVEMMLNSVLLEGLPSIFIDDEEGLKAFRLFHESKHEGREVTCSVLIGVTPTYYATLAERLRQENKVRVVGYYYHLSSGGFPLFVADYIEFLPRASSTKEPV
jgi:hypothetical protein